MKYDYILGLDLGVGSIGAAMVDIGTSDTYNPDSIKTFVRIFDASTASTANADRRTKRLQRRTIQRRARRQKLLWDALARLGFALPRPHGLHMWEDSNNARFGKGFVHDKNPWFLRFNGVRNPLAPFELGYALYHISNHRASSAIRDIGEKDTGVIQEGVRHTRDLFNKLKENNAFRNKENTAPVDTLLTFGAAVYYEQKQRNTERADGENAFRIRNRKVGDAVVYSEYIANRGMIRDELQKLLHHQKKHHASLNDTIINDLIDNIIDYESEKIVPDAMKCLYYPNEPRLPKAHPMAEKKRILESLNNTRLKEGGTKERHLTTDERQKLLDYLMTGDDLKNAEALSLLSLPATGRSLKFPGRADDSKATSIAGSKDAFLMAHAPFWKSLSLEHKETFIKMWISSPNDKDLKKDLIKHFNLDATAVDEMMTSEHYLKLFPVKGDPYTAYGETITSILIKHLEDGRTTGKGKKETADVHFLSNTEALELALNNGEIQPLKHHQHDRLPYYGEVLKEYTQDVVARSLHKDFEKESPVKQKTDAREKEHGRIPNPVVHRTLNEIRKLVNGIIDVYGMPQSIRVEYGRELSMNEEERSKLNTQQNKNEKNHLELVQKLRTESGVVPSTKQVLAYQLTKAQGFVCAYSGRTIDIAAIMNGRIEIDHILPKSRSLDDSQRNKVACFVDMNQIKGNKTPHEAFYGTPYWTTIEQLIRTDSNNPLCFKAWRFADNAMEEFKRRNPFLNRYKTDNSYIAKATTKYLKCLYPKNAEDKNDDKGIASGVETFKSGALSQMRKAWGLNDITWKFVCDTLNTKELEELAKKDKAPSSMIIHRQDKDNAQTKSPKAKLRIDHRHHALDALVVALAKRGHQQIIQREHGAGNLGKQSTHGDKAQREQENAAFRDADFEKLQKMVQVPYGLEARDFRSKVKKVLLQTVVSYRYDHGKESQLHEDTLRTIYPDSTTNYISLNTKSLTDLSIKGDDDIAIRQKIEDTLLPKVNEHAQAVKKAKEDNRKILAYLDEQRPLMDELLHGENEQKRLEQVKKDEERKAKDDALVAAGKKSKFKPKGSWTPTNITPKKCWERALKAVAQKYPNCSSYNQLENFQENTLFFITKPTETTPGSAYKCGNNFCLDLYHDNNGVLQGEIIRSYAANRKHVQTDYEKKGYKRVERLFNGDIVEVDRFMPTEGKTPKNDEQMLSSGYTGAKEGRVYLRLLGYSYGTGSLEPILTFKLLHKSDSQQDLGKRFNPFKKLNPRRVLLNPLGGIVYRSPRLVDKQ